MSISVGRATNLIELWCKGVDPQLSGNHELIREIMNMKLRDFAHKTAVIESKATISSVASQTEYELPVDADHIKHVFYDDYEAEKITFLESKELASKA